jgi:hypothetical protein
MTQAPAAIFKIPTESPQPAPSRAMRAAGRAKKVPSTARSLVLAGGNGRAAILWGSIIRSRLAGPVGWDHR